MIDTVHVPTYLVHYIFVTVVYIPFACRGCEISRSTAVARTSPTLDLPPLVRNSSAAPLRLQHRPSRTCRHSSAKRHWLYVKVRHCFRLDHKGHVAGNKFVRRSCDASIPTTPNRITCGTAPEITPPPPKTIPSITILRYNTPPLEIYARYFNTVTITVPITTVTQSRSQSRSAERSMYW